MPGSRYPRAAMQARVIERVSAGCSLKALSAEPGFPTRRTVHQWAKGDAAFAAALKAAMAAGKVRHAYAERAELQRRVVDRIERGGRLIDLQHEPGFPSRGTVAKWAREDAGFRQRLAGALAWRRARGRPDPYTPDFQWDTAQRLLARVRAGERLMALVGTDGFPRYPRLRGWRRERADFDAELRAAVRAGLATRPRRRRWPAFDRAVADRIIVRVGAGEPLGEVARAACGMPPAYVVKRWRALDEGFAAGLEVAIRIGRRRRFHAARGPDAATTGAIVEAICQGASLNQLAARPDMPSWKTLQRWLAEDAAFCQAVAWASRERDLGLLDQGLEIAERVTPENHLALEKEFAALQARIAAMRPRGGKRAWRG